MNMRLNLRRPWAAIVCICLAALATARADTTVTKKSHKTIDSVLREPLPPEDLSLAENTGEFVINGPTFSYRVQKISGVINSIHAVRDGQEVIASSGPADLVIDQYRLASTFNSCQVTAITNGKDKIVIQAKGFLHDPDKVGPNVDFVILHTFFNDGVVVSNVKLVPRAGGAKHGIGQVIVAGRPAQFFYDSTQGVAYGEVTFTSEPLEIEVSCSPDQANKLPEKTLIPDALTRQIASLGK